MINILYLFVTLPIGGAEQHLLTVLRNLDQNLYKPMVCCIRGKGAIGEEIENLGFPVIALGRKSKKWDYRIIRDILRIIRTNNINLLHTHLHHANRYGRIAAWIARIPVVSTEHSIQPRFRLMRKLVNMLLAMKTDRMIAVSRMVKDHIITRDRINPSKVKVIYNGIDVSQFPSPLSKEIARERIGIPMNYFVVGTVGRLSEEKGHIYLIDAISRAKDFIPDLKLVIVGSGPLESHLKKLVAEKNLDTIVLFTGVRRDIPEILKALDVFALPSLREGFPVALLEAMASYLPVVTTPVGGINEIIQDGENGLLVNPGNGEGIVKVIIDLYKSPALRERIGCRARETVIERFSASTMIKNLDILYQSVLSRCLC